VSALRVPTEHDIPQVVRLMSEHAPEPAGEGSVRRTWSSPTFDLGLDARIEPRAYARVEAFGDDRVWVDLQGRPSQDLLDWAESRAGELGARALAGSWTTNKALLRELEQRGFRVVRYSQRMAIDLDDTIAEPVWPEGVAVRSFQPGDERTFYEAHQEAFADTWEPIEETYEYWAHWVLEAPPFDPELWFLAEQESETAGFAICKVHASAAELGWVFVLGVRRPWRGRGLGRALLLHAFHEFRRRGLQRASLGVDAESPTGANRLYESVGMSEVARFEVREKVVA